MQRCDTGAAAILRGEEEAGGLVLQRKRARLPRKVQRNQGYCTIEKLVSSIAFGFQNSHFKQAYMSL